MNDDKIDGRLHGEQPQTEQDGLGLRLVYTLLIMVMLSVCQTMLGVIVVVQFVVMALNKSEANENLADFGTDLGVWMAKAVRYVTGASAVKPWPWTEID